MGGERLTVRSSVDLDPAKGVLEIGAARERMLHTGRTVDLVEPTLGEQDETEPVHVASGEG